MIQKYMTFAKERSQWAKLRAKQNNYILLDIVFVNLIKNKRAKDTPQLKIQPKLNLLRLVSLF